MRPAVVSWNAAAMTFIKRSFFSMARSSTASSALQSDSASQAWRFIDQVLR